MPTTANRATATDLLAAATQLFGQHGYDGVSTRMLAEAAGTNVSSIRYHYGGKEQLYVACLDHIITLVQPRVEAVRRLAARAESLVGADRAKQAEVVQALVHELLRTFLDHPEIRRVLPIVLRELILPGPWFQHIYNALPRVLHETVTGLVAWIDGRDPQDPAVVLRSHALIGSLVVFQIGRPILLRRLAVDDLDPALVDQACTETSRVVLAALGLEAPDA